MKNLKDLFLLNPEVIFLNHGSFGATPRPVFDIYQAWQRKLERQPVEFLGRRAPDLLADARASLADYLGVKAEEVVYFSNPTTAINMVVRSLDKLLEAYTGNPIHPGDTILTTNHEYGAMDRTWRFICQHNGMRYQPQPVSLPISKAAEFVEAFWKNVDQRTRIVFLSHITSPTALFFPVAEICRRAREHGILSIVDGAHAPGQISLDLKEIGADIYTGACHKWLMAPKGSAFLYVRRELQEWLDPLVVSWGYQAEPGFGCGHTYVDYHEWQGTRDLAAFLAVPAAIEFQRENHWDAVRDRCHHLARATRQRINQLTGLAPICPDTSRWFGQMFSATLPGHTDLKTLKERLYTEYRIEIPTIDWNGSKMLRASFQGYNTQSDADALVDALEALL